VAEPRWAQVGQVPNLDFWFWMGHNSSCLIECPSWARPHHWVPNLNFWAGSALACSCFKLFLASLFLFKGKHFLSASNSGTCPLWFLHHVYFIYLTNKLDCFDLITLHMLWYNTIQLLQSELSFDVMFYETNHSFVIIDHLSFHLLMQWLHWWP